MYVIKQNVDQSKLRTRFFSPEDVSHYVRITEANAKELGKLSVTVSHAGSVPNNYGYRASTTGIVVVSDPNGKTLVWLTRLPANKVTLSGVLATTVGSQFCPLRDERYSEENKARSLTELEEFAKTA